MSIRPVPKLIGKTTILLGVNDLVEWWESAGGGDRSATVAPGEYFVDDLVQQIAVDMNANTGNSSVYIASMNDEAGIVEFSTGVNTWYPKISASESQKLLTGGDVAAGEYGTSGHFGFAVDASYPSAGLTHTSDIQATHCWFPNEPPKTDPERVFENRQTVETEAHDGTGEVWDFSGAPSKKERRPLSWHRISRAARDAWFDHFWGPIAGGGEIFRYYRDRGASSFILYRLTGDSLRQSSFVDRELGFSRWSGQFTMKKEE